MLQHHVPVVFDLHDPDDRARARWTWNATHTGDFLGIAPTGRRVSMTGLTLFRLGENGKIAESWWQHDHPG
ncbi:ester cyclase [Streptomyces griseoluteus]|uniref:ester cyclase n=1 Tax=Streptomyces griseoluteus TaxID=29306 RepID=UPI003702B2A7